MKALLKRVAGAFGYDVQRIRKVKPIVTSTRDPATLPTSIHYACGSVFLQGWLNVDARNRDGKDVFIMDLTKPHPFPNDWFEWGYCEDFVEHLTQPDSFLFLAELYRTFKPGGICRFSFPYLEGTLMYSEHFRDYEAAARVKDFSYTQD
jgi:predicted SAM-dependent methyltransferase